MPGEARDAAGPGRLGLFDLDNTLFERDRAFLTWCHFFVEAHALPASAIDLLVAADRDGHAPRSDVFAAARSAYGLDESVAELTVSYREHYPRFFAPDPAILSGLKALRAQRWRTVIVTNGPPSQVDKIRATGLDGVVDGWCISDVVGAAKPDRAIFDAAARTVGMALSGYMIGDTLDADVVGGAAVGLTTVWLARGRPLPAAGTRPDVIVDDIAGAFAYLLGL